MHYIVIILYKTYKNPHRQDSALRYPFQTTSPTSFYNYTRMADSLLSALQACRRLRRAACLINYNNTS